MSWQRVGLQGCIPFFDVLNHCHDANKANTELMMFGECIDQSSEDGQRANVDLNRRNMILVLTKEWSVGRNCLLSMRLIPRAKKSN